MEMINLLSLLLCWPGEDGILLNKKLSLLGLARSGWDFCFEFHKPGYANPNKMY